MSIILRRSALSVLVVEHDADTADTTAELLHLYGYAVRVAVDGATALDLCDEWQPDAVLLTLRLPDMTGYEVATQLRDRNPFRRPLVAAAGLGRAVDRERSLAAGVDLHLVKPIDPVVLRRVFDRLSAVLN